MRNLKSLALLVVIGVSVGACSSSNRRQQIAGDSRYWQALYGSQQAAYGNTLGQSNQAQVLQPGQLAQDPRLLGGNARGMNQVMMGNPQGEMVYCKGRTKAGCPEVEKPLWDQECAKTKDCGDKDSRATTPSARRDPSAPATENGDFVIVGPSDPSLSVATGLCSQSVYDAGDTPAGNDADGIAAECEKGGQKKGFYALNPRLANVFKVAAVRVPKEKKGSIFEQIFKKGQRHKEELRSILTVDGVKAWLEGLERLPIATTQYTDHLSMPSAGDVGLVAAGNNQNWLTLGGINDPEDANEDFSVAKLPGMASAEGTLKETDGFLYVVEGMISFPGGYNPRVKIVGSSLGAKRASALVLFVNGNLVVETFSQSGPVSNDLSTTIKNFCPRAQDCHLVAYLYSERKSNKAGDYLVESLLIDLDPRDNRGYEPLPSEIASPVALPKTRYSTHLKDSGQAIRVVADASDSNDRDLIEKCGFETAGSGKVDLTDCRGLFMLPESAQGSADPEAGAAPSGAGDSEMDPVVAGARPIPRQIVPEEPTDAQKVAE